MKVYRGHPAAARAYVEADRGRVDDYYLAEGTGVARRLTGGADGPVVELAGLQGERYEAWVAGVDPDTGEARGRLRCDARAVRFVEVVVNGPKSWSLAAELHPDVAAAYEAAQDQAAEQIVGWLGAHATVRVGPRGGQVAVPVQRVEAAVIRHYTSRAGDPHRHLHVQVNARVFAGGRGRGLDTVMVRDSLGAVNGIGHAAVMTDPAFRTALARHGYTLEADGEIRQLAPYVGAFSKRAAQIARHLDRYEAGWQAEHPGRTPGPALRRAWDARAWADGRPDKGRPVAGEQVHDRWLTELARLGYRDADRPVGMTVARIAELDRDEAARVVLARLGAERSAWNAADGRGEVEQLLARHGVITDPAVRNEVAEDLTARALAGCVPLLDRAGVPGHVRALASPQVLAVERDLVGRLAVRGADPGAHPSPGAQQSVDGTMDGLDAGQRAAVAALAGDRPLVVVEGSAGAGKTTTLAVTRDLLAEQGRRLVVVTPTLRAAQAAARELGTGASSAARLAFAHGWRWDQHASWTRLRPGQRDPVTGRVYDGPAAAARLRPGDVLLVDEAGMLGQDTARALLAVADEAGARVALLGDRHQLPAVGRGGVLDHAVRWVDPAAHVTLDVVHRFVRTVPDDDGRPRTVPDTAYAELTVTLRGGDDPGAVFDALHARGHIGLHPSAVDLQREIATAVAADRRGGRLTAVVVNTREQVAQLNAVIRDRLVDLGVVDDRHAVTTRAGDRVGTGDRVATRRNDRVLDVSNRDTWIVTATHPDGRLTVRSASAGSRVLPAGYAHRFVELAYASTAHGVQGDTTTTAHLVVGEHTGAATAYVGMTRGRASNTAHLVADSVEEAREQWLTVFGRDRADLGPAHAAHQATRAAAGYNPPRPLAEVVAEVRRWWTVEADAHETVERLTPMRDALIEVTALHRDHPGQLAPLQQRYARARPAAAHAQARAQASEHAVAQHTAQQRDTLLSRWTEQRPAAAEDARVALAGGGRLGLKLPAVNRATESLARWAVTWQPVLPDMPTRTDQIAAYADRSDDPARIHAAIDRYARTRAEHAHPDDETLTAAAHAAAADRDHAHQQLRIAQRRQHTELAHYGRLGTLPDPDRHLTEVERQLTDSQQHLNTARAQLSRLAADPALVALPGDSLSTAHTTWHTHRTADLQHSIDRHAARDADEAAHARRRRPTPPTSPPPPAPGHSVSR